MKQCNKITDKPLKPCKIPKHPWKSWSDNGLITKKEYQIYTRAEKAGGTVLFCDVTGKPIGVHFNHSL